MSGSAGFLMESAKPPCTVAEPRTADPTKNVWCSSVSRLFRTTSDDKPV